MTDEKTKPKRSTRLILLPIALLALAVIVVAVATKLKPEAAKSAPETILPTVETITARAGPVQVEVRAQGTVQSRTETQLVAEVSGRVLAISPKLYSGGFFQAGDTLVEIDSVEYEAALATARSRLAEAKLSYEQEKAAAAQAIEDWRAMGKGDAPALARREPQIERAEAMIDAAKAGVAVAERDLERTRIKAPYTGQVREKRVDLGQMVTARTSPIAVIYSIDAAEIRLPLSLDDLRYLNLTESYLEQPDAGQKPKVAIEAEIGGKTWTWSGVIDRVEGAIDQQTRLIYVVAQVANPFSRDPEQRDRPPLMPGLWVTARIQGEPLDHAIRLPRLALRNGNEVYVVNEDNRLSIRQTQVYKSDSETAIITDGIKDGERVCVTPIEYAVEGMKVETESKNVETSQSAPQ